MDKQLANLDREIARYNQRMRDAEHDLEVYDALGRAIERYCSETPENISPSLVEEPAEDPVKTAEMDAFVEEKRMDDRDLIMDKMVYAKQTYDDGIINGTSNSGDDVDAFLGGLLEGVLMS